MNIFSWTTTTFLSTFLLVSIIIATMSTTSTSAYNYKQGLIILPAVNKAQHSATIIVMHGLGDSGEGLRGIADYWQANHPSLSHIKFILPTAPIRPVTINQGHRMPAWYDIAQFNSQSPDPTTGVEESALAIKALIEDEMQSSGLPLSRIALAGFSQGGSMSLFTGLQEPFLPAGDNHLAGLLVLSGRVPKAHVFQLANRSKGTPILHCHGTDDRVVRMELAQTGREQIISQGFSSDNYEFRSFQGVGHSISRDILEVGAKFFDRILPAVDVSQDL